MNNAVFFLEPKGTAFAVVKTALNKRFFVILFTQDLDYVKKNAELYEVDFGKLNKVILVKDWDNYSPILDSVKELENEVNICGFYSNVEQTVEITAFLRSTYNFPTVRKEVFTAIIDKYNLRKILKENGLSDLENYHGSEVDNWDSWKFDGAAYFKPVRGTGSLFITKCNSILDAKEAKQKWLKSNPNIPKILQNYLRSSKDYHLEEEIDGNLFSVEGISSKGYFKCLGIVKTIVFSEDPTIEMGSCFPFNHPLSDKIISTVKNAHKVLGLTEGPTHTEVIVKDGIVEIVDLNPRFIGADVMFSINNAFGIQIQEILFDWIVGSEIPEFNTKPLRYSCLQYIMAPKEIEYLKTIDFIDDENIVFKLKFIPENKKLTDKPTQVDVVGVYLTTGTTFENALNNSKLLRSKILLNKSYLGRY